MSATFLDAEFTLPLLDTLVDDASGLLRALHDPTATFRGRPWWVPRYSAQNETQQAVFDQIADACCRQLVHPLLREPAIPLYFLQFAPSELAIPKLHPLLGHRCEAIRIYAMRALGEIGSAARSCANDVLQRLIRGSTPERVTAAATLRLIDGQHAASELAQRTLDDPDPGVRFWSAVSLARLSESMADQLIERLLRRMPERRCELAALILTSRAIAKSFGDDGLAQWDLSWLTQALDGTRDDTIGLLALLDDPTLGQALRFRLYRLRKPFQQRLFESVQGCDDETTIIRGCRWIAAVRFVDAAAWLQTLDEHPQLAVRLAARTARLRLGHLDILPEWMQLFQHFTPRERLRHLQRWADPWIAMPPLVMMPLMDDPTGAVVAVAIAELARHWAPLGIAQAARLLQRLSDRPEPGLLFPAGQNERLAEDQAVIEAAVAAEDDYRALLPDDLQQSMRGLERDAYRQPDRWAMRSAFSVLRRHLSLTHLDLVYRFLFHPSRLVRFGALLTVKHAVRQNPPQVNIAPETDPHVLHLWHQVRF